MFHNPGETDPTEATGRSCFPQPASSKNIAPSPTVAVASRRLTLSNATFSTFLTQNT